MKDANLVTSVDSLVLVTKSESSKQKKTKIVVEDFESDISYEELTKEDKVMMVTNPKKFFINNFSRFRKNKNEYVGNNHKQESSNSEKSKNESFKNFKRDSEKENKLFGDSCFDCNTCHGKNHFAKECMLQKQNKKKEKDKDEAYYRKKIEELRKNSNKPTLVVIEDNSDDGNVEVWSTDSHDKEVCKPTH